MSSDETMRLWKLFEKYEETVEVKKDDKPDREGSKKRSLSRKKFEREDTALVDKCLQDVHNKVKIFSNVDLTDGLHDINTEGELGG